MIDGKGNFMALTGCKDRFLNLLTYITRDNYVRILVFIVILGAVLRYYGLTNAENTDEYNEVIEALRVASGKFNLERWWKKGYQNILAVEYGIYYIIGYLIGIFKTPMDFAAKIVSNMEPLFLIGRITTATLGTASIALTYLTGRNIFNAKTGLIAAGLFALSPVHVWTSHLVNTDVPLTFFFLSSCYFITRAYYSGRLFHYACAALLGAIAINIKLIGAAIGILFLGAHIVRCKNEKRPAFRCLWSKEILWSAAFFVFGLVLSNPPIVVGIKKMVAFHFQVYTNVYDEVPYAVGESGYYTYLILAYKELGLPLFLLSVMGLCYSSIKRDAWGLLLLLFLAVVFVGLGSTTFLVQDRYLMIALPVLFILTGRFVDCMVIRFVRSRRIATWITAATVGIAAVLPLITSLTYVRTLTEENTSVISKRWIEENIPARSKLLIDAGRTMITFGPRLSDSRENLEAKLRIIKALKEGETFDSPLVRIVDSYAAIYFELLLKNMPEITYDITSTELGRKVETFEYYRNNGYQYVITNGYVTWRAYDNRWAQKYPKSAVFYTSLPKEFQIVKTFDPSLTRSGPTVVIYKVM
jgi:hypothetical protein